MVECCKNMSSFESMAREVKVMAGGKEGGSKTSRYIELDRHNICSIFDIYYIELDRHNICSIFDTY